MSIWKNICSTEKVINPYKSPRILELPPKKPSRWQLWRLRKILLSMRVWCDDYSDGCFMVHREAARLLGIDVEEVGFWGLYWERLAHCLSIKEYSGMPCVSHEIGSRIAKYLEIPGIDKFGCDYGGNVTKLHWKLIAEALGIQELETVYAYPPLPMRFILYTFCWLNPNHIPVNIEQNELYLVSSDGISWD